MDLVINGNAVVIPANLVEKVKIMGFNSITVIGEIDTAEKLASAIKLIRNPYIDPEEDYKEMKGSNFDFLYTLLEEIKGVEITSYKENKIIYFSYKGTNTILSV